MLNDYKNIYIEKANLIKNWKSMSKSDLCNYYIDSLDKNDGLSDSYLSAIICKFWGVAEHNYYSQKVKEAKEVDCYNNLIDSILYVLENHIWTDPKNKLYGDELGPEKAMNVVISSRKLNIIAYNNRIKRKLNKESLSLESIQDFPLYVGSAKLIDKNKDSYIDNLIIKYFNRKEYFKSFLLDAIINCDVFQSISDDFVVFSEKKLRKHLRGLIEYKYYEIFSNNYNLDLDKVKIAASYVVNLNQNKMKNLISQILLSFKNDKQFLSYLRG